MGRWHYFWSFVALALAVHLKAVPIVLAPVWVAGSLSRHHLLDARRLWPALVGRSLLLLTLVAALFVPAYALAGPDVLGFFAYHRERPVEMNSTWSTPLMAARLLGQAVEVEYSYGSINVRSSHGANLMAASSGTSAVMLTLAALGVLIDLRSRAKQDLRDGPVAVNDPGPVIGHSLLLLMLFIAANKVFSPQYLLWLAPLVALLPPGRSQRLILAGFLATCVLTTALTPFLVLIDMFDPSAPVTVPRTFLPPSPSVAAVQVARNVLFLGLTATVALFVYRRRTDPSR